jgi:hypothetical protein
MIYILCDVGRLGRIFCEWLEIVTKSGNVGYKKKHTLEYIGLWVEIIGA